MVEARGSREGSLRGGMTGDSSPSLAETETTVSASLGYDQGRALMCPVVSRNQAPNAYRR